MSEETVTVKGEIQEYIENLNQSRHDIKNMQVILPEGSSLNVEAESVVTTINGLMEKLEKPGLSDTVDLPTIVKLSDEVTKAQTSASHVLAKRPPSQY